MNIEQLEPCLRIIDDGKEILTEVGRIDITAEDKNGSIVVIEIIAGIASHDAIGQILAYMGAIFNGEKQVRGILIARDFTKKALFSAKTEAKIKLIRYSFQFTFSVV
jgi:RecB family endonuclease NucS